MKVRFEPIGEEIECSPEETVLDAAFRNGYNLVHGCREGQCSACKCFLMEGDVALKPYSTFALSESEQANGYSLMCRAMPEQDLVVELLHFDPDDYRLAFPIRDGEAIVEAVQELTNDITHLVLRADEFEFTPGQYVDLWVPGSDGAARRSFSMSNVPADGRIELMIKRYPGGKLSGMLEGSIKPGDRIGFTGPYGSFRLRHSEAPILMIAGGSGMAPVLSVLRKLAADGCARPVRFYYGARSDEDLFHLGEIASLGDRLEDFVFTPVVGGFVHDAVDAFLASEEGMKGPDVYMCGPPPMVEAAEEMLIGKHKLDERRIFQDKFTTSADAGAAASAVSTEAPGAAAAPVKKLGGGNGASPTGTAALADPSERDFGWYRPRKRRATLYEDVTVDTQPSVHRHLNRGWPVSFEDGRGTWDDNSTALRSEDWFEFRDPGEQWERTYYQRGSAVEQQIDGAIRSAIEEGLMEDFSAEWIEFLRGFLQVPAYVEHGLWFAMATAARDCLSDSVATCVCLQAAMKQRSAQAIVLYAMDLEQVFEGAFPIETARESFLADDAWQPTRAYVERLASLTDWGEVLIAANLCFEPIVGTLIRRELGMRAAAANGDTVTPVLARVATQEWEWTRGWTVELIKFLCEDASFGASNRQLIAGWVTEWLPLATQAAAALAPLARSIPAGIDPERALEHVRVYVSTMLVETELPELGKLVGHVPAAPVRRQRKPGRVARTAAPTDGAGPRVATDGVIAAPAPGTTVGARGDDRPGDHPNGAPRPSLPTEPDGSGTYDYVGIVMAKSAEGDAVAAILGKRDDIEVIEQPSFWDIRARDRLVIPYEQVSEQLGYEIDAYSIQHEMSTHYGRMVAGDEALMLFSDPTEAMEYLMS